MAEIPKTVQTLDLDDAAEKRGLLAFIRGLTGLWCMRPDSKGFSLKPWRPQRTPAQNNWYWCEDGLVQTFTRCARESNQTLPNGMPWNDDASHATFKYLHLPTVTVRITSPVTGEIIERQELGHTPALDTAEFSDYCEKCRATVLDLWGEWVEDPDSTKRRRAVGRTP